MSGRPTCICVDEEKHQEDLRFARKLIFFVPKKKAGISDHPHKRISYCKWQRCENLPRSKNSLLITVDCSISLPHLKHTIPCPIFKLSASDTKMAANQLHWLQISGGQLLRVTHTKVFIQSISVVSAPWVADTSGKSKLGEKSLSDQLLEGMESLRLVHSWE